MRRLTAFVAIALAAAPGIAGAAEPPCLTPAEFSAVAGYAMPTVVSSASQRCAASLGPDAYLRTGSKTLVARYTSQRAKHWPGAKAAFMKLSVMVNTDASRLFRDMADTSLQPILDGLMEGLITQNLPLERCATIDRMVRLLAPLPPGDTAEVIALGVGLVAGKGERARIGKLSICPSA